MKLFDKKERKKERKRGGRMGCREGDENDRCLKEVQLT